MGKTSGVWKIGLLLAGGLALGAAFALGMATVQFRTWPYPLISQAYNRLAAGSTAEPRLLLTKFLDLEIASFDQVLPATELTAGALAAAAADEVLLLQSDGAIYLLKTDELSARALDIEVPPNGLAAIMAESFEDGTPTYKRKNWHRYIDIEFHDGALYLSYSHFSETKYCITSRLARLELDAPLAAVTGRAADWDILFETSPCFSFKSNRHPYAGHQAGGHLAISGDGGLYMTVGDYEFDGYNIDDFPQDPATDYGKVWRFDLATGARRMVSLGHRNPQGIVVTPRGEIWATEHGPEGGDELNYIVEGSNYGWPLVTYGTQYGREVWPVAERQGRHDGYRQPAWAWIPSIAVSSIDFVDDFDAAWDGDLLLGSLKDQSLHRAVTDGQRIVMFERVEIGERIRDLLVHAGYILLYTDSGRVLRLSPRPREPDDRHEQLVAGLSASARTELNHCLECHARNRSEAAPNLCGVLGRPVGRSDYEAYSASLSSYGGRWDEELLMQFLEDADGTIPGVRMPDPQIDDPDLRQELLRNLDFFCS